MNALEHETKRHRFPFAAEVSAIALAFALVMTACGWLWLGRGSPFNHGVFPDVYTDPDAILWVVANFPAGILFVNLFGKNGPEWTYFLCVFIQWFTVGIVVGVMVAGIRRIRNHV